MKADEYRKAALYNLDNARILHENGRYAGAHYLSGLAVECMLRAYRTRVDPAFDARHDLRKLFDASRFSAIIPMRSYEDYFGALTEVFRRWNNAQRYMSEESLLASIKKARLHFGVKGNPLKESCRRLYDAAHKLVNLGDMKWSHS